MPTTTTTDQMLDFARNLQNLLSEEDGESKAKEELDSWLASHDAKNVDDVVTSDEYTQEKEFGFLNQRIGSKEGWSIIHVAALLDDKILCDFFLKNGANIEAKTDLCNSPLSIAAKNNCTQSAEFLLDEKANIESLSKHLKNHERLTHTPLIRACGTGSKCLEMIKLLLERGADPMKATIRNRFWKEDVKPYHTTLTLLISNSRKCESKKDVERLLEAIECIIKAVPEEGKRKFINKKTIWTEIDGFPECSAMDFLNIEIASATARGDNEKIERCRSMCNVLERYGAASSTEFLKKRDWHALYAEIGLLRQNSKKSFTRKVADLFAFWAPFAICHEIFKLSLSFETVSKLLENDYINFHDRRITFISSCIVALAVFAAVYNYQKEDLTLGKPTSLAEDANVKVTNKMIKLDARFSEI